MPAYSALKPLLFRLAPESAHHFAIGASAALERALEALDHTPSPVTSAALRQEVAGVAVPNPVGLAAGFDKNAEAPHAWAMFGFGFAELGTITRHAQPGNPQPRLFRLAEDRAIINRMGFNNMGADEAARRLRSSLAQRPAVPIGLNLGKSKITLLEEAPDDYAYSFKLLAPLADYIVVNVSSPNTPGLRDLQDEAHLAEILRRLADAAEALDTRPPVFVKLAPDLADDSLVALAEVAQDAGAMGLIATNTTVGRTGLRTASDEAGGLSGAPLRDRSTAVIRHLYQNVDPKFPIIGVGGIFSAKDAYEKIRAGACLVQIYSAMIYEGPFLAKRIARGLEALLRRDGFGNIREAVGTDA